MASNRPETSIPASSTGSAAVRIENGESSLKQNTYVPSIFDLVLPTLRMQRATSSSIPSGFLQSDAVDSSLLIGRGASFVVTRQAIPPGPKTITIQRSFGGGIATQVFDAPKRPTYVVYKSARVRFQTNGDPATADDARAMLSVLTELHALLLPSLQSHPNIITLLGLAWGSNHANPLHRLPVLVIEYGDKGTLADIQSKTTQFTKAVKVNLCLGIASGLQVLHEQGIVHGDMKPENVIICSGVDGVLIPKLADFGFAIMEASETGPRYIGGTRTWRAPESSGPVQLAKLKATDVYSFGLVVWSIACQANDPFSLVLSSSKSREIYLAEIDRLKMDDEVLAISKLENWFIAWLLRTYSDLKDSGPGTQRVSASSNDLLISALNISKSLAKTTAGSKQAMQNIMKSLPVYAQICQLTFPSKLESIFEYTLKRDPDQRNLEAVIKLLKEEDYISEPLPGFNSLDLQPSEPRRFLMKESGKISHGFDSEQALSLELSHQTGAKYTVTNTSNEAKTYQLFDIAKNKSKQITTAGKSPPSKVDWTRLGFKLHRYSWQSIKDLEPGVQNFVVKTLLQLDDGPSLFMLSACLINGYGIASDARRAVNAMIDAAKQGHRYARANLYRVSVVCAQPLSADVPIESYLLRAAAEGSRAALSDLCQLKPESAPNYRAVLRYRHGGVGAYWFAPNQWLCGLDYESFLSADFKIESLGSRSDLSDLVINLKGDHIIHAAAALDACLMLKPLLEDNTFDVNQRNALGETAILCACRSGHANMVSLLLDNGADASIQSLNGESPLHWLSSFDPRINPAAVGKDLIERGGAQVDCLTKERISHSPFFNSVDVDHLMPGSPLYWAVHHDNQPAVAFLLSRAADPNLSAQEFLMSPLERAAFFHHHECMKLMVEYLEKIGQTVTFGPLIQHAIGAADNLSMILRNGVRCLNMLESTLLYLKEKTKHIDFQIALNDKLLYFAAREGQSEAIKIILQHGWLVDEINLPTGSSGRTAILESVRWNRIGLFKMLMKYGADPSILSASPYNESEAGKYWSALHLFADQGHNEDITLVDELLAAGVPVDGDVSLDIETPLNVSIRRNAFRLADHLRDKGASVETTSYSSALIVSRRKLTILGHMISLNGRYSFDSLQYLLKVGASFMVCPDRGLTALHLCALVPEGLTYHDGTPLKRADFDLVTSRMIMRMLLEHFSTQEQLNQRLLNIVPEFLYPKIEAETGDLDGTLEFFADNGETALHLAVEVGNIQAVELLVAAGADKDMVCFNETLTFETPADIAERIWKDGNPDLFHNIMEYLVD